MAGHVAEMLREVEGIVLGYVALPDEVSLEVPLTDEGRVLCLPRLGDGDTMTLHVDDGRRERHRVGIDQPRDGLPDVDPASLAAVLVPGRVFDRDGYRLGRGGGHYDRLLPRLSPGALVVGVTIEGRIVDRLPREPHDRPVTHLTTEKGTFSTK